MAVRQAVKTAGIDGIALTKLDVLDGFDEMKICTGYRRGGEKLDSAGRHRGAGRDRAGLRDAAGWRRAPGRASWADLPATAIKYIRRLEELIERAGRDALDQPGAEDTIHVRDPFAD